MKTLLFLCLAALSVRACPPGPAGPAGTPGTPGSSGGVSRVGSHVWVDPVNGHNFANTTGLESSPFKTIAAALASTPLVGTVELNAGIYTEPIVTLRNNIALRGAGEGLTNIIHGVKMVSAQADAQHGLSPNIWAFYDLSISNVLANTTLAKGNAFVVFSGCSVVRSTFITPIPLVNVIAGYLLQFENSYLVNNTIHGFVSIRSSDIGTITFQTNSVVDITSSNVYGFWTVQSGVVLVATGCVLQNFLSTSLIWTLVGTPLLYLDATCWYQAGVPSASRTIVNYLDDASVVSYTADGGSTWDTVPGLVNDALDQLAAITYTAADASIAIAGTFQAPTFRATGAFGAGTVTAAALTVSGSSFKVGGITIPATVGQVLSSVATGAVSLPSTTFVTVATLTSVPAGIYLCSFDGYGVGATTSVLGCQISSPAGTVIDSSLRTMGASASLNVAIATSAYTGAISTETIVAECNAFAGAGISMANRALRCQRVG